MAKLISGIQQVGIGVLDVHRAWAWYRKAFGIDVRMFEESAEAALMKSTRETKFTPGMLHWLCTWEVAAVWKFGNLQAEPLSRHHLKSKWGIRGSLS